MRFYLIWCGTTRGEIDFSKRNFRLRIQPVHNAIRSINALLGNLVLSLYLNVSQQMGGEKQKL